MAHHYWPNAKIVAVEPHPQSFELMTKNTSHIPDSQLLRINAAISSKPGKCLLSFPVSNSRVADYVPDVWEPLEPPPISPARGPPTDWGELVPIHDDRDVFQASPDEPPVIDIHSL